MKLPFSLYLQNIWILIAVLLPNLLFLFLKPKDAIKPSYKNLILKIFEHVGRIGMIFLPFFYEFRIIGTLDFTFFGLMMICLVLYYACWIRYFVGRSSLLLYGPFVFIPVPLALSPVIYFLCAAVVQKSILLFAFTLIFSIGHLPISRFNYLNCKKQ